MQHVREFLKDIGLLDSYKVELKKLWQELKEKEDAYGIMTGFSKDISESESFQNTNNIGFQTMKITRFNEKKTSTFHWNWIDVVRIESEDEVYPEVAVFLIGDKTQKLREFMCEMAQKYNQDRFIYKGPGVGSNVQILSKTGELQEDFPDLNGPKMLEIYNKMRGVNYRDGNYDDTQFEFLGGRYPLCNLSRLSAFHHDKEKIYKCL